MQFFSPINEKGPQEELGWKEKLGSSFVMSHTLIDFNFVFLLANISSNQHLECNTHNSHTFLNLVLLAQIKLQRTYPKEFRRFFARFVYTLETLFVDAKLKLAKKKFSYWHSTVNPTSYSCHSFPWTYICKHYSRGHITDYSTRWRHLSKAFSTMNMCRFQIPR